MSKLISRRTILSVIGAFAGIGGISTTVKTTVASDQGTIEIADQSSDGTSVIIDKLETDIDAELGVLNLTTDEDILFGIGFEAGTAVTDYELEFDPPITESFEIQVSLHDESGSGFALDQAAIEIEDPVEVYDEIEPTLVDADPEAGFNYPYFLYAPTKIAEEAPIPVVVEPTNTGTTDDDLEVHLKAGENTAESSLGRDIVDALGGPLVIPVFPRPAEEPVDWSPYIHALDRETMQIDGGPLERVDLQLLAMVEDAKTRLDDHGYPVLDEGIILTGFSASGNFVERFVTLHPDKVHSASAGGLNGMVTLPIEELQGQTLEYHIGIANLEELTGEAFDRETYRDVPQFLYLGEIDTNDTIPFNDAWTGDFDQVALEVYGQHMQDERFPLCRAVHESEGTSAIFRMYEDTGHSPRPAMGDLIEFHQRVLDGDDIEAMRSDLGGGVANLYAYISFHPVDPISGEQVVLDGTLSDPPGSDVVEYSWEIDGETTLSGEVVTHTFEEVGGHAIRLSVTTDDGVTYEAIETLRVRSETIDDLEEKLEEKAQRIDELEQQLDGTDSVPGIDSIPGFGIAGTVASILGVGYVFKWWKDRGSEATE